MTITFKTHAPNGDVRATVSGVTSYSIEGQTITIHRCWPAVTIEGRPSLLSWTENYKRVSDLQVLPPNPPSDEPAALRLTLAPVSTDAISKDGAA